MENSPPDKAEFTNYLGIRDITVFLTSVKFKYILLSTELNSNNKALVIRKERLLILQTLASYVLWPEQTRL